MHINSFWINPGSLLSSFFFKAASTRKKLFFASTLKWSCQSLLRFSIHSARWEGNIHLYLLLPKPNRGNIYPFRVPQICWRRKIFRKSKSYNIATTNENWFTRLYSRFNKCNFIQIFSYDIESLDELVINCSDGFFVYKLFCNCMIWSAHYLIAVGTIS